MNSSPRRVLISIHSRTHLRILEAVIERLSAISGVTLGIVLVREELSDAESRFESFAQIYRLYPTSRLFKFLVRLPWPGWLRDFFASLLMYRKGRMDAVRVVSDFRPDFVFLSADRYFDFDLPLLNLKNRKFKTAVVGIDYLYVENYETYALNSKPLSEFSSLKRWFITHYFPDQIYSAFGKSFTFFPFGRILAFKILGVLYPKPQLIGSNPRVDFVFVDGDRSREVYLREGFEPSRVFPNTLIEHDEIFLSLKNREEKRRRVLEAAEASIVVLGVPQLLEHNLATAETHWREIEYLFKTLSAVKAKVLLSLHPKQKIENYTPLASKYGLTILDQPLKQVIAIADVYIATFSSTVLWGAQLGIPTLVLDLYGFKYSYFRGIPGVKTVSTRHAFEAALSEALTTGVDRERGRNAGFGVPDGESWNRLIEAIDF